MALARSLPVHFFLPALFPAIHVPFHAQRISNGSCEALFNLFCAACWHEFLIYLAWGVMETLMEPSRQTTYSTNDLRSRSAHFLAARVCLSEHLAIDIFIGPKEVYCSSVKARPSFTRGEQTADLHLQHLLYDLLMSNYLLTLVT